MNKKCLVVLMAILILSAFVYADVPPDPDELRVSSSLNITTEADLSDYRFFVDFSGDLNYVEIKSKSFTIIEPMGSGVRYNNGALIAVLKKHLKDFPEKPTREQLSTLSKSLNDKSIDSLELGKHQFSSIIKLSERANWTYPTYRIDRNGDILTMVKTFDISRKINQHEESRIKGGGNFDFSLFGLSIGLTPIGFMIVISLLSSAIIIFGIWIVRRKGRNLG